MKQLVLGSRSYLWLLLALPFIFPLVFLETGTGGEYTALTAVWNTVCEAEDGTLNFVPISFTSKLQVPAIIIIPTAILLLLMTLTKKLVQKTFLRRSLIVAIYIPIAMAVLVAFWIIFVAFVANGHFANEIGKTWSIREDGT